MKTIGFVCEGPRDVDLLSAVIEHILQEQITPLFLQPDQNLQGDFGNGWKGVWKWCEKKGKIFDLYMQEATPNIDLIVIQMDGDVSRKEKEAHCLCMRGTCPDVGKTSPLECRSETCPIVIPCVGHVAGVNEYFTHLTGIMQSLIETQTAPVYVIPCDSTDAWIVAAYDELEAVETIVDPWDTIISRSRNYHGIRIPGHKKTANVYRSLLRVVCDNWHRVTRSCTQACAFEEVIREKLT